MREKSERPDLGGPFPEHLAVIMDGNGRWAKKRGLKRILGHREGVNSVREMVTECARMGVKSLTLYAFSIDNWKRPKVEVIYLMKMLRRFLIDERPTLMDNGVRLAGLGRLDDLPADVLATLRETEQQTAANDGMLLRIALSYGARSELADAARSLALAVQSGRVKPEEIDEESLRAFLYDPATPDPDLLIRTAGEMRLSNFLLWQISYAELYVTEVCWPEFRKEQLLDALRAYARRNRTYGGLLENDPTSEEIEAERTS